MSWILSNLPIKNTSANDQIIEINDDVRLFFSGSIEHTNNEDINVYIAGYLLPRTEYYDRYGHLHQDHLILQLYKSFGLNLIHYVKGIFNILIVHHKEIYILNDVHGIKSYFKFISGTDFIITDDITHITNQVDVNINLENIAIYSLMNNFPGELTPFDNVSRSKPASIVNINNSLSESIYWNPSKLLDLKIKRFPRPEYNSFFKNILQQYIDYLNPDNINLTLTGGMDSRLILSFLLNSKQRCKAFSYGDGGSSDVSTARLLAGSANIQYDHYHPELSPAWFNGIAERIVGEGNAVTSIHRAHRYHAFLEHFSTGEQSQLVFTGHMGGELYRNFYRDGLIITDFIYHLLEGQTVEGKQLESLFQNKFLFIENMDLVKIQESLQKLEYYTEDKLSNKLNFTFKQLINHHAQDINLLSGIIDYPVPFYLDIDLIEFMFSTRYNFIYNETGTKVRSFQSQKLFSDLISDLSPQISKIPFSKRGYYSPWELSKNPMLVLYIKRIYRYLFKNKIVSSFVLGDWMHEFINSFYNNAGAEFGNIFDKKKLADELDQIECRNESCWRTFSNPVFISMINKHYGKPD